MLNERKFRSIYEDYLESGLTIRAYCANHQINEAKFFYWKKKLKNQLEPGNGFVPLVFDSAKPVRSSAVYAMEASNREPFVRPSANQSVSCEITYPNGVCIKLTGLASMEGLRSLLQLSQPQDV